MARTATAPVTVTTPSAEQLKEARGWLKDCGMPVTPGSTAEIVRTIHRQYDGGWPAFLNDTSALA